MSNGCSGPFKSRHCVADLMNSCSKFELTQVGFHYYASHEGKNTTDTTIGSIVKSELKCGMFKHPKIKYFILLCVDIIILLYLDCTLFTW